MAPYELSDFERIVIQPILTNKPRGVTRVDDRRVINGIFWALRSGDPWQDKPGRYGPYTTAYNRFNLPPQAGVWGRLMDEIKSFITQVDMIKTISVGVHQQATAIRGVLKTFYWSKPWRLTD